jgi:hypothetical protein
MVVEDERAKTKKALTSSLANRSGFRFAGASSALNHLRRADPRECICA